MTWTKVSRTALMVFVLGALFVVLMPGCGAPASSEGAREVPEIASTEEFTAKVLQAPRPVMVDFYADWCGPCRRLAPTMDALAKQYAGRVDFVRVNVDKHGDLAQRYGVRAIPLVVLIRAGSEAHRWEGAYPAEEYRKVLETIQP
jgi:thioredoxin 1